MWKPSAVVLLLFSLIQPLFGQDGKGEYEPLRIEASWERSLSASGNSVLEPRAALRHFGVEEGLKNTKVYSLLEDDEGYLWIGTGGGGLFRFDGQDFEQFGEEDGIKGNRIQCLFEDDSGRLWVGTDQSVLKYDGQKFTRYTYPGNCKEEAECKEALLGGFIYDIEQDKEGRIWIASAGGGVSSFDGKGFTYYVKEGTCEDTLGGECVEGLPGNVARMVQEGPEGRIWMGTFKEGMVAYDGDRFSFYGNEESVIVRQEDGEEGRVLPVHDNVYWSSMLDEEDRLWIGTSSGVFRKEGPDWKLFKRNCDNTDFPCDAVGLEMDLINDIEKDGNGGVWLGTYMGAGRMVRDRVERLITTDNGLSGQYISDLEPTADGSIWIGTPQGLDQSLSNAIEILDERNGLAKNVVHAMARDIDGQLWLGHADGDGALDRMGSSDTVLHVMDKEDLRSRGIQDMCIGRDSSLWVATNGGGAFRYKEGRIQRFGNKKGQEEGKYFPNNVLMGIMEARDGSIWTAGEDGVARLHNDSIVHFGIADGLANPHASSLVQGPSERVWVASPYGGISVIHPEEETVLFTLNQGLSGTDFNAINDLVLGPQGELWVASGMGLHVLEDPEKVNHSNEADWELFNKEDGLPSDGVNGIHFDEKDRLWVATDLGAAQLDPYERELRRTLKPSDGFLGLQCTGAISSDKEGRILFGTQEHLIRYDPSKDQRTEDPPALHIERVSIGFEETEWRRQKDSLQGELGVRYEQDSGQKLPKKLSLPYDRSRIVLDFQGIDLRAPDRVEYRYRLKGSRKEGWSPWRSERRAVFNDLSPGSYVFEAEARNRDKRKSGIRSFRFTIRPPWWETLWFRSGSFLVLAVMVVTLFRWRTASIRKQNEELEEKVELRTRDLEEKKEELALKNREITDGIDYASSIQAALLPEDELLHEALGEHFVLFRPRDPVSGDFYWCYAPRKDLVIWIVADCTGHGVPGAFMSMMGHGFLDEVVVKGEEYDPGNILNEVRQRVKDKIGKERRDGMDAAVCAWDKKNGKLHFAGANNPLYLIRKGVASSGIEGLQVQTSDGDEKGNTEFVRAFRDSEDGVEVKGNKNAVAVDEKEEGREHSFRTFTFPLKEGDLLYTFTDGLPDQFGGPKDKKFGYQRFKKLLTENAHLPMKAHSEALKKALKDWKGDREQVDDICIIGVRIPIISPDQSS